jgi:hypothetical protein
VTGTNLALQHLIGPAFRFILPLFILPLEIKMAANVLIAEDDLNLLSTLKYNLVKEVVTYRIGGRALDSKPVVSSEAMVGSCGGAKMIFPHWPASPPVS